MITYTVYKVNSKVYITKGNVDALRSLLNDDKVEVIYQSTKEYYAYKTYERELREQNTRNPRDLEVLKKRRKIFKEIGRKYGPVNGKKVGAYARDSGHLKRLRDTKVICPDNHRSNLQHYKSYCRNRGFDIDDCIILE